VPIAPTRFRRVDWVAETERLRAADLDDALDAEGLARLGLALELTGHPDEAVAAWDRAHRAHLLAGDRLAASRCVFWIGFTLARRGAFAQAGAWRERLAALIAAAPDDSPATAMLLTADADARFWRGDQAGALERFERAGALAERFGEPDLQLLAVMGCGRSHVRLGESERAAACMDQVMLLVAGGGAGDLAAGAGYCGVIASCVGRRDVERAREWTGALSAWCEAQEGLVPFRGECMVHRATLLQLAGAWPEAERTLLQLLDGPQPAGVPLGLARYEEAELLRLTGRLAEAERSLRAAVEAGFEAQPGLGRLRLAQGRGEAARAGLERALTVATAPGDRADLLDALVEVCLDAGDVGRAERGAAELLATADLVGTSYLRAQADRATGCVLLAQGDAAAALRALRRGWAGWQAVGAPYESARTRVTVALAARALGDEDAAGMELDAARQTFAELGAATDLARVDALSHPDAVVSETGPLSPREVEVLRLVARGCSNREIAERLFLSERTVARHVGNILAKLQLANRAAATAFAYEHGLVESE
jgi:DNA-binding NarL/FixJ family response regulator